MTLDELRAVLVDVHEHVLDTDQAASEITTAHEADRKEDREEIFTAWGEAGRERHRADVAEAWSKTKGDALDLDEAQIAHVLTLHTPTDEETPFCKECSTVYPCHTVRVLHGEENGTDHVTQALPLTPEDVQRALSWWYAMADDIIPDAQDRELARRLGNFAHIHGLE